MELNLHPIATKSFVSGREFAEHDRVVSYLVRPYLSPAAARSTSSGQAAQARDKEERPQFARYDLLESEDSPEFSKGDFRVNVDPSSAHSTGSGQAGVIEMPERAFVYCRWVVDYKPRNDDNSALHLKLTAENLFLTLAIPAGTGSDSSPELVERASSVNTPLLQFLALMMERKKQIKLRGYTEDGQRQIYEHMASHQMYEVPLGDLNVEFFQKIQEHLGVLVGTPKPKVAVVAPAEPVATTPAGTI